VNIGLPKSVHFQLEKRFAKIKDNELALAIEKQFFFNAFNC